MRTVFAAGNWTERNAAMTQEQHFDQGEMVDGRASTLCHRKITVRCRDTFWRHERHQQEYVEVLRTHATLLPTITSRVGRTVVRGPCAEALEQRWPQETGYATTRTHFIVLLTARQLIPTHDVRGPTPHAAPHAGAPEVCLVTSRTTHRWHVVHFRDRHKGLQDPL